MGEANARFRSAIEQGDVEAALRADDELHGIPVASLADQDATVATATATILVVSIETPDPDGG